MNDKNTLTQANKNNKTRKIMDYFNSKLISNTSMAYAKRKVEYALQNEGFGVLTEMDIQSSLNG
jgi:uncharacterized protein (DUF302 family)